MSERKKSWTKPQLIVLGRGRPEEKVLAACKRTDQIGPNADTQNCQDVGGTCSGLGRS